MDTKSYEQFLIIQSKIESTKQESDDKQMKTDEKLTQLTESFNNFTAFMMDQTNHSKSSQTHKDTSTPPDPTTVVSANNRGPPLEGGHSTKISDMCNLKHEISSLKFYELLIKT